MVTDGIQVAVSKSGGPSLPRERRDRRLSLRAVHGARTGGARNSGLDNSASPSICSSSSPASSSPTDISGGRRAGGNTAEFIRRRFARLYPLHLATLGFYVMVGAAASIGLLSVVRDSKYAFNELPANLLLVHAWGFSSQLSFNYVSWSISAEWFVYLLFPLIAWAAARPRGLLAVAAAFAGVHCHQPPLGRPRPSPPHLGLFDPAGAAELCARRLDLRQPQARRRRRRPATRRHRARGQRRAAGRSSWSRDRTSMLCSARPTPSWCSRSCATSRRLRTPLAWQPISRLGTLTYSIYMLHPVVATVLLSFLAPRLLGTSFWATVVAIGVAIRPPSDWPMLSYRFFEEPARQMLTSPQRGLRFA